VLEGGALGAGEIDSQIQDAQVRTLLGQLAYRLGGPSGFAKVEEQDRNLRGSSTTQIAELLEANAPCLILLDELLQLSRNCSWRARRLSHHLMARPEAPVRSRHGSPAVRSPRLAAELMGLIGPRRHQRQLYLE
jgi:predicted AAA+ superfamily ATPase